MRGYQLKITVKGSKPPIWRRILAPDKISFRDLDDIIEEAFGWTHSHMFSFYFREADESFQGGPMAEPTDTADARIDGWLWEGCTFLYTYDFGDDWEHTVTVEKILPYDKRYPQVIKSKGPNMIEDCGGIWGFYDCIDDAEPFDLEEVNARFRTWDMAEMTGEAPYEDVDEAEGWSILNDLDGLEDVWDMDVLEDGAFADSTETQQDMADGALLRKKGFVFDDGQEASGEIEGEDDEFPEDEEMEELRRRFPRPVRLLEVYAHYKKGELEMVARANGFARHGAMKKAELSAWLCEQFLSEQFFSDCVLHASRDEIELFEAAMEEDGILLSEELVSKSLLLCTYGAFAGDYDFYRIPADVEEKYREITKPEFRKKQETSWMIRACCDAALYLYGVLTPKKLSEICRQYGKIAADEEALTDFIRSQTQSGARCTLHDGYLMDAMLLESNMYRHVIKKQEPYDYYIPETWDEFLQYGELECQEPDEKTQFYLDFLQKKCRMGEAQSLVAFYTVQEALRMNAGDDGIFLALENCGCNLKSDKFRLEVLRQSRLFNRHVRHWDLKGHTPREIQGDDKKIVPFVRDGF